MAQEKSWAFFFISAKQGEVNLNGKQLIAHWAGYAAILAITPMFFEELSLTECFIGGSLFWFFVFGVVYYLTETVKYFRNK